MPDLSGAPPTIGASSKGKLQSQRGGKGRFSPASRSGTNRGGASGKPAQGSGTGTNGQNSHATSVSVNPQHPGHIPGSIASRPLNGVFAIDKPSGKTCMELLDALKDLLAFSPLFRNPDGSLPEGNGGQAWRPAGGKKHFKGKAAPPKIGQGGTLDPLASGVLVIGLGSGTKKLQTYLHCKKTYETTGLLGTATTSYDSQDPVMTRAPHSHVNEDMVRALLPYFTGPLLQYPPIYSACKMDGKRLFDYARQGLELPRPIEAREIEIVETECYQWLRAGEHTFAPPEKEVTPEEKALLGKVKAIVDKSGSGAAEISTVSAAGTGPPSQPVVSSDPNKPITTSVETSEAVEPTPADDQSSLPAAAFKLRLTVSGGTYVRSIVHDVGQACGSAAHVVELRRVRQGEWAVPLSTDGNVVTKRGEIIAERQQSEKENSVSAGNDKVQHEAIAQDGSGEQVRAATEATEAIATSDPSSVQHGTSLLLEDKLGEAEGASEEAPTKTTSSTDPTTLPCLPWSLFLSALEEQKRLTDPNARNDPRRRGGGGDLLQRKSATDQQSQPQEKGEEEEGQGQTSDSHPDLNSDLKEWERRLLSVIQPC